MADDTVFNPLDKRNLGKSVFEALLEQPAHPLEQIEPFSGAGIYAIYYFGEFGPYAELAKLNAEQLTFPIYTGKAIPKGGRKGIDTQASLESTALFQRIREHRSSVENGEHLKVEEFSYRYLVVDDIWIGLGESLLIQHFRPLWNQVVDGFGNHDPGASRKSGKKPLWDELHPGRSWAAKLSAPKKTRDDILADVAKYMDELADRNS